MWVFDEVSVQFPLAQEFSRVILSWCVAAPACVCLCSGGGHGAAVASGAGARM